MLGQRGGENVVCKKEAEVKKIEVPLFPAKPRRGRPIKYNFAPFLRKTVQFVVYAGVPWTDYESFKNAFYTWRKENKVRGRYEYDYREPFGDTPSCITIWRIK